MSIDTAHDLSAIWHQVRQWPPAPRLALATRILQSLQEEETAPEEQRKALNNLIGIWKSDNPPTDEEVERMVEEERMRKYG
jgi:hypothetical protein